jgi:hypothetical protein
MKEEILNLTIPAKKELREFAIKMKQKGLKMAPMLALVLGRYIEQYLTQDDAIEAIMKLYNDYKSKLPVIDQIELDLETTVKDSPEIFVEKPIESIPSYCK